VLAQAAGHHEAHQVRLLARAQQGLALVEAHALAQAGRLGEVAITQGGQRVHAGDEGLPLGLRDVGRRVC